MATKITRRIESDQQLAGLLDALGERISASDLQSLLLEAYRMRSEKLSPNSFLSQHEKGGLFAPSGVDARLLHRFDAAAFEAASDFSAIDLSPVCPLGASFILGGTSQNNVLTTIRNAEVLGDSTIALALLCAQRRRSGGKPVHLCASHRVVRLQPFDMPGFTPHFRLFSLVSAGRDRGSFQFEMETLRRHVEVYLRLFEKLGMGPSLVEFSDMAVVEALLTERGITREEIRESVRAHKVGGSAEFLAQRGVTLPESVEADSLRKLEREVLDPLTQAYPKAVFRVNLRRLEGLGYYGNFTLRISPLAPDGNSYPVVDGGFTDWTARLLGNRKERVLISGIGAEFVCKKYLVAGGG